MRPADRPADLRSLRPDRREGRDVRPADGRRRVRDNELHPRDGVRLPSRLTSSAPTLTRCSDPLALPPSPARGRCPAAEAVAGAAVRKDGHSFCFVHRAPPPGAARAVGKLPPVPLQRPSVTLQPPGRGFVGYSPTARSWVCWLLSNRPVVGLSVTLQPPSRGFDGRQQLLFCSARGLVGRGCPAARAPGRCPLASRGLCGARGPAVVGGGGAPLEVSVPAVGAPGAALAPAPGLCGARGVSPAAPTDGPLSPIRPPARGFRRGQRRWLCRMTNRQRLTGQRQNERLISPSCFTPPPPPKDPILYLIPPVPLVWDQVIGGR